MGNESSRSKGSPASKKDSGGAAARLQKAIPSALKSGGASGASSSAAVQRHLEHAKKSRALQLKGTSLKAVPPTVIDELAAILRTMDLSTNKLRELPTSIGAFSMLKQLHLSGNRLTHLPDEIGCLKTLELLNASDNELEALPESMAGCNALAQVNLANNKLGCIPVVLTHLLRLEVLDLSGNTISAIPDEISDLRATELILQRNELAALNPDRLLKCPRLKILRVDENCLPKEAFTAELLERSELTLITYEGNLVQEKEFQALPGYDAYEQRFTATKRRLF